MVWLLLPPTPALAHGGDDHGGVAPVAAVAEAARVPTWSTEFEAVLRLDDLHPGVPGRGTLLVANFSTSAPVSVGTATLDLGGPADLSLTAAAGTRPGEWPFEATFPAEGPWTGSVTVLTPERSDVLGLPAFHVVPHEPATTSTASAWVWTGQLCLALGGLLVGLGVGVVTGRLGARQAASGAAVVVVAGWVVSGPAGWAHGGEDHAAGPAPDATRAAGELRLPLESQFLLGLRTELAATQPFAENVRALGTTIARPGGSAELHSPVTGLVAFPEGRTLVPGELVRAGDLLVTIRETMSGVDRSSFVEARAAALVRLAEARKKLSVAERDLERSASLGEVLSERERLEREKTVEVAREEVRQGEQAARAMEPGQSSLGLRAPMSGRISALAVRPGDTVAPADVLLRVTDGGGLWVEASVPETWAGRLAIGNGAVLISDAHRDLPLVATVLDPGLEADPASGTLRVVLAVGEPVDWLVPGMSVTASIETGTRRDALTVPDGAVVDSAGESLVFVKTAPERFEVRPIRAGGLSGARREVLVGLAPGERVVVDGTYALRSLAGR
jgi:RND family efflux transporter MFP subunit